MVPSENLSTKELGLRMVCSVAVGASVLPSVFVAKSCCGGWEGGGIAGRRAGAVLAAGAVSAAVWTASSTMAAGRDNLIEFSETSDKRSGNQKQN